MKTEQELIDYAHRFYVGIHDGVFRGVMQRHGPECESPIERVMLGALLASASPGRLFFRSAVPEAELMKSGERDGCYIHVQQSIGQYRCDFVAVVIEGPVVEGVVIECDGHDFHERTKEQAARDRKRDRDLITMGFTVLRFTGSEIWRNPVECANQALIPLSPPSWRALQKAVTAA